jgi:hypothetical protein
MPHTWGVLYQGANIIERSIAMPINELSDIVRIPRLGKIRLGIKVTSKEKKGVQYPKATDHFVVPDEVKAVYGEKPTELQIMFPVEEPELFAQQWLRAYSMTQGLVCIGSGVEARRKIDVATGTIADHETKQWEWREISCDPQECPEYQTKRCRRVMNLQFLLPEVPGLGVYQIDTSSFYSIVNINSMIKMLKGMLGRCSMVPLTLALGPIEVCPPGLTKKTVQVMHIKKNIKLSQLAQIAQLPPARVLIPEADTAEPPEDLFAGELIKDTQKQSRKKSQLGQPPASPKDEDLFLEEKEQDLPQVDAELLKGWLIVKGSIKQLNITDNQIRKWFAKAAPGLEIGLDDFNKVIPPENEKLTNELLSKFESVLEAYRERQKEKTAGE